MRTKLLLDREAAFAQRASKGEIQRGIERFSENRAFRARLMTRAAQKRRDRDRARDSIERLSLNRKQLIKLRRGDVTRWRDRRTAAELSIATVRSANSIRWSIGLPTTSLSSRSRAFNSGLLSRTPARVLYGALAINILNYLPASQRSICLSAVQDVRSQLPPGGPEKETAISRAISSARSGPRSKGSSAPRAAKIPREDSARLLVSRSKERERERTVQMCTLVCAGVRARLCVK
ncbi:hypothetical protein PUN28_020156 [Cardiocondyla obscurior]|uniref:Uncharacterized protein n=1 Tax=Cardiocondyla obscurior TaxID=286306 RepID=A0AAW2E8W6_9HYME